LGAFLAQLALLADLLFFGATWARCGATRAFLVALGSSAAEVGAVPVSWVDVMVFSPLAVITVHTSITPVRQESKAILPIARGDRTAVQRSCNGHESISRPTPSKARRPLRSKRETARNHN
jgi:hypothetical protein